MKKGLAVLLTAALLLTSLVIPSTAATAKQVITQNFDGWTNDDLVIAQCNGSDVKAEIVEADGKIVKSGKALKFTSATGTTPANNTNWQKGVYFTDDNTKLKIGSTYKVSFLAYRVAADKIKADDNGGLKICQYSARNVNALYLDSLYGQEAFLYTVNLPADEWVTVNYNIGSPTRVEYTFKATAAYPLFVYYGKMNEELYVDDITLTEVGTSTVDFYDGETQIDQAKGLPGSALTLPTPKKEGYAFEGWYTDSAFKTAFTANVFPADSTALYAKFTSKASVFNFNGLTTEDIKVCTSLNVFSIGEDSKIARNGNYLAATPDSTAGGTTVCSLGGNTLTFERGKTYRLSFWLKRGEKSQATTEATQSKLVFCANSHWNAWANASDNENKRQNIGEFVIKGSTSTEWMQYSYTFTSGVDDETVNTTSLCLKFYDFYYNCYIDDIEVLEVAQKTDLEIKTESNMSYAGTAMRPATTQINENNNGKMAIRFKSSIAEATVQNGVQADGKSYTVEEYGHLCFRKDWLGDGELTVDTAVNQRKPFKAVAYNKTQNVNNYFEKKDGNIYFTAALYGFTEAQLSTEFVVRPYVILTNGLESKIVYGATTQCASLAEVADRAYYAQPGDFGIPADKTAYTDVSGNEWYESYNVRKDLYDSVLSKLDSSKYIYEAPAAEK